MSSKEEKVSALLADCRRYNLAGLSFVSLLPLKDICAAYNGIGPEQFHPTLRKAVDHLAPALCRKFGWEAYLRAYDHQAS